MKILFDFLPIILFFTAFKIYGIYAATAVAILATAVLILIQLIRKEKIAPAMWISLVLIVIFGGATIIFHNEWFIKWKPTVLYWLFALVLILGELFFKKNFIQKLAGTNLDLPEMVWKKMLWSWSAFFIVVGILNIAVAYNFSTEIWVDFKLFGLLSLTLIFAVLQGFYLGKHINKNPEE